MMNGLLPIGSVVLLKNSQKKIMVVGVCQKNASNPDKIWDYTAVLFPEGYLGGDKMFMFDHDQIEQVYALGYQDAEQMAFKEKIDQVIVQLREGK